MGVKDFNKIVAPNGRTIQDMVQVITLAKLVKLGEARHSRISLAIDASYVIYNSVTAFKDKQLTAEDNTLTSHISVIFNKVCMFKKSNINQVWIFDSPEGNASKKYAKRARTDFKMTADHIRDVQYLLENLGIVYYTAPKDVEAEHICALFTSLKYCDYVLSNDTDVLCFGGNMLMPFKGKYYIYDLDMILMELFPDDDRHDAYLKLVRAGVHLGNDFNVKSPGIGAKTVLKKIDTPLSDEQEISFNNFTNKINMDNLHKVIGSYNEENIISFLTQKAFNRTKVTEKLQQIFAL
jgi:hypothetical protein